MWHALPIATPWDLPDRPVITEPLFYRTYSEACRHGMGLVADTTWPISPLIRSTARLNDALTGSTAKTVSKQRVWTFPTIVEWHKSHAHAYDGNSTYLFFRHECPVEMDIRHIRVFTEAVENTNLIWRNPNWHNEYEWSIICPTSTN